MQKQKKWNRKLGSKRSQGITTPPAPQNSARRRIYFMNKARKEAPWYIKLFRWIFRK